MKSSHTSSKKLFIRLATAALLLVPVCSAKAQLLLTINDSDPSAVTITATGLYPGTTTSQLFNNGIDLLGFFETNVGFTQFTVVSSTLTTGDASSGPIYDTAVGDNISTTGNDLTLYSSNPSATETFTSGPTGAPAFIGTATLDLAGQSLPAAGVGTIVTGYSGGSPNVAIGEWEVTTVGAPEPRTWILLLVAFVLITIYRSPWIRQRFQAKSTPQNG